MKPGTITFQIAVFILTSFCRLLAFSWRIRVVGIEHRRRAVSMGPGSFVLASFHENAIAGILSHPRQGIACLASRSKDGEFVAQVCEGIGLLSVRGSSSRGGKEAREELLDLLKKGTSAAITIDGPKGPRRRAKAGIVDMARKSGAPMLPIVCFGENHWTLSKTWDQTRIPKPFTRFLVKYGEPIAVPENVSGPDFEQFQTLISETLGREDDILSVQFDQLWDQGRPFDL